MKDYESEYETAAGELVYRTPAPEFELARLEPRAGRALESGGERGVELLLCTEGEVCIRAPKGDTLSLERGSSAIAAASAGRYCVEGEGCVYRARVGVESHL